MILVSYHFPPGSYYPDQTLQLKHSTFFLPASGPFGVSLVVQMIKNLPAMQETWIRSPGWEDPLEEGMATHSIILAWGTPSTEEPGRLQSMGSHRVGHN